MKEKIHNYGSITYNKKKKQVEFTYFVKDSNGEWQKRHRQEFFRNEVYIPNPKAVVDQIQGKPTNYHKDIFGNAILNNITCDFYSNHLPMPVQKCPKKFSFDIDPATKFLAEHFEFDPEEHEIPPLRCQYLDIETVMDDKGFIQSWSVGPDGKNGYRGGVTLISSYDTHTKKTHVFGIDPYKDSRNPLPENVSYVWCKDEKGVLREYMQYLKRTDPDILAGWNLCDYDIPYILNRLLYNFGKKSLWHFGNANAWIKNEAKKFLLFGINAIDYMALYKKFELTPRRSYKLDDIVEEEGIRIHGKGKHKYEGSLRDFCENDWDGFVRYCVQDAELVSELDNKKKLLETFIMCCYMAGVSFDKAMGKDVSWLRIHDSAIYRYCQSKGYFLPETKDADDINFKFSGAYVMEPKPGLYDYVTVFDVASLYPSCIRALNISIDAYRGQVTKGSITEQRGPFIVEFYSPLWVSLEEYAEHLVESNNQYTNSQANSVQIRPTIMKFESFDDLKKVLVERNLCIAANGAIFTKDFRGIISSLLDEWIAIRKKNKGLMFENKELYQKTGDEKYKVLSERYNTIQNVFKVRLNSLYGFLGSKWSRFYHTDLAEAVTSTGQFVIKTTIEYLQKKNPFFAAMYCDTDSIFLNYGEMLRYKGIDPKTTPKEKCVEVCLQIDKEVKFAIEEGLKSITQNIMLTDNYYDFETEEVFERLDFLKSIPFAIYASASLGYP
jgi:DNA polymerase elongation subunit (family B)